jgi:probable phosphoglycerate mutase
MPPPVLYYVRHGETDWNAERRLQGQHDIPLNDLGRVQADRCGEILGTLLAQGGRLPQQLDYIASPLGRARETMERLRAVLGLDPEGYRTDARLMEMSFGRWEGFTFAELQAREANALAEREGDKWNYVVPGGESYALLLERVRAWYGGIERDTVVSAHGGVARVLLTHLGVTTPDTASHGDIGQGVVYVLAAGKVTRHDGTA